MPNKLLLLGVVVSTLLLITLLQTNSNHHLTVDSNFQVKYQAISSILRTNLSTITSVDNTIYVGDSVGSLSVWTFDPKKSTLSFEDISRKISGALPPPNNVQKIQSSNGVASVLTEDGNIVTYSINSAQKIVGNVKWDIPDKFKNFILISKDNQTYMGGLLQSKKEICLYKLNQSFVRPNPINKIGCNRTQNHIYDDIAYDPNKNLISTGNNASAYIFSINFTSQNPLSYVCNAFLPKAEVQGFQSIFTLEGTLVAINDLWLNSISIDVSAHSCKIVNSERTQRYLKTGQTDRVSISKTSEGKITLVMVNSKNKLTGFNLEKTDKLSFINDSKELGKPQNFVLKDENNMFSTNQNTVVASSLSPYSQSESFLKVQAEYSIVSNNHFADVNSLAIWNDVLITGSLSAKNNVKVWKVTGPSLTMIDQKSISIFNIQKSGYVDVECILMLPPINKTNANATLHVAFTESKLYDIVVMELTSQYKIKSVVHSKDAHFDVITGIFLSPNKQNIISFSMDTLIMVWNLNAQRDNTTHVSTFQTKYGPITHTLQDKSGVHFITAHANSDQNKYANLAMWIYDEKAQSVKKITLNSQSQANLANITHLLFSQDEKYFITANQRGELRLWKHQNWTIISLLSTLPTTITSQVNMRITDSNKLLIESAEEFAEYSFDSNGFISLGKNAKEFETRPTASLLKGDMYLSGDKDGSIRSYALIEG